MQAIIYSTVRDYRFDYYKFQLKIYIPNPKKQA